MCEFCDDNVKEARVEATLLTGDRFTDYVQCMNDLGWMERIDVAASTMALARVTEYVRKLKKSDDTLGLMERCVREGLTVKYTYPRNTEMYQWSVSGHKAWAIGRDLAEAYVRYVHEVQRTENSDA